MKELASISLSGLAKKSVCTYWWGLPIYEYLWDTVRNDLDEIKTDDNKINVEWIGLVDFDDVEIDYEYDDDIWDFIIEKFNDNVDTEKLAEALKKYGVKFDRLRFYKNPWAYNYAWDSLDMVYEYDDDIKWQEKYPDLIPYVKEYIDNVRVKSYDWYCSFEPTSIDRVEYNDTTLIWAILKKEWIDLEEVGKQIEDWVYDILEACYEYDRSKIYLSKWDDWKNKYDTEQYYYVDFDNNTLKEITK